MQAAEYQKMVERTKSAAKDQYRERLGLSAAGIAGEAAELAEVFRGRALFGARFSIPIDRARVVKEAGDLCWYLAHLLTTVDQSWAVALATAQTSALPRDRAQVSMYTFDLMLCAGKLVDYLKKLAYHEIVLDLPTLHALLLPVSHQLLALLWVQEIDIDEVFEANIAKLRARYPQGFNTADSLARKDGEPMT